MEGPRRKIIIDCCLKELSKPDQILIWFEECLKWIIRYSNGRFRWIVGGIIEEGIFHRRLFRNWTMYMNKEPTIARETITGKHKRNDQKKKEIYLSSFKDSFMLWINISRNINTESLMMDSASIELLIFMCMLFNISVSRIFSVHTRNDMPLIGFCQKSKFVRFTDLLFLESYYIFIF